MEKREEVRMSNTYNIPVWEKYTLTIEEAAAYFRIGEHKLRNLVNENKMFHIKCQDLMYKKYYIKMYN